MGPVADAVFQDTGNVQAALVRFVAILDIPVGAVGDIAAVSFDLHVAIDHA